MTFLPIVERELRSAARSKSTYRNRVLLVLSIAPAAVILMFFWDVATTPSQFGKLVFALLSGFAVFYCWIEGPRKTADCLSREKRDGTLGLLFLTDLKGHDIVIGKLVGLSLNSIYGLIGLLPVLSLPILLGGLTINEFWRMSLALLNLLFFSLCTGIWASSLCRRERLAETVTFLVVLLVGAVPLGVSFWSQGLIMQPLSPVTAVLGSTIPLFNPNYWTSMFITQAMSWALVIWASIVVPRSWQEKSLTQNASRAKHLRDADAAKERKKRFEALHENPAYWLVMRDMRSARVFLWVLLCLAVINSAILLAIGPLQEDVFWIFFFIAWTINFLVKARIAIQACHCLAQARENSALEMLLVSPLNTSEIINGQLSGFKKIFLFPVSVILAVEAAGLFGGSFLVSDAGDGIPAITFVILFVYLHLFIIDFFALVWAGMWFGLTSPNEGHAVRKTIFLVLVLPFLTFIFFCFGFIGIVAVPVYLIVSCTGKVTRDLRKVAAQRFEPKPVKRGWRKLLWWKTA